MGGSKWNSQSDRYSKEETTCISRLHSGQNSRDPYYEQYLIVLWQISYLIIYQCLTCYTDMEFSASMLTNTPSPTIFSARFCSRPRPAPRHAARSVAKCSSAWSPASFNRFDASDANRPRPRNIAKMMESDGIFGKAGFVLRVLGIDNAMISSGKESVYLNPRKVLRKKSPRAEGVGSCNFQFECFAYPFRKTGSHVSSFTETVKTPMMKLCSCVTHGCHKQSAIAKSRKTRLFQKANRKLEIILPHCLTKFAELHL